MGWSIHPHGSGPDRGARIQFLNFQVQQLEDDRCRPPGFALHARWAIVGSVHRGGPAVQRLHFPSPGWADRLALGLLVAASAWLLLAFARGPGELAAIWIGNGIVAGWLLNRRMAAWPGYLATAFLAELPVRLLAGDDLPYALVIAGCNVLEAGMVALAIRWWVPDIRKPSRWMLLGGVATAAALVACAVAGLVAAVTAWGLHGQGLLVSLGRWYAAHVVGMVAVGTMTLVIQREGLGLFHRPDRGAGLAATILLVAGITVLVFLTSWPLLFVAFPVLLLAAVRHRFAGASLGVLALGTVAGAATALDLGPLAPLEQWARIAVLQLYIAAACLLTIPACLAMAERDRLRQRLEESHALMERLSRVDALTGLPNRRQLDERLELSLARLQRARTPVALLCLDVDRFKQVNDTHGHAGGDIVLQAFASRLLGCLRATDLVARPGGDEFVVLLDDAVPGAAERVAECIIHAMQSPVDVRGVPVPVATSIGISHAVPEDTPESLMAAADAALYAAKESGRNRYRVAERRARRDGPEGRLASRT